MQGLNKRLLEHMFANGSSNMDTSKLVGLMIGKWKLGFSTGVSLFLCRCSSKRKDWGVGRSRARPGSPLGFEGNSSAAVVVVTFHRNSRISAVRSAGRRGESGIGLQRAWAQRKVSGSCLYRPGSAIPRKGTLLSARG